MADFGRDDPALVNQAPAGLGPSGFDPARKPYRPHNLAKHAKLVGLARSGATHPQIAAAYGGTKHGVRANLRRLRERGVL